MLNKKPIFLIGFARGGTNILLNLLRSHPEVCSPRGETDEVFRGKGRFPKIKEPLNVYISKLWNYLPVLIWQKQDVFSTRQWDERRAFLPKTEHHIDKVLFDEKLKAIEPNQNLYKTVDVKYVPKEIRDARLLSKNINGLIFITNRFYEMYPDATFIALVRNGLAVCEGHIRRGADPAKTAQQYEIGCQKMIMDSENYTNFHIFRYEDIIQEPQMSLECIYDFAELDPTLVKKVRLETTKVLTKSGNHRYVHNTNKKKLVWYDFDKFGRHFDTNINENQIKNLSVEQKEIILQYASSSLNNFSYI